MVVSREADYAVRMMLALAAREPGEVVSARLLAEETLAPYELARSILNRLANRGLLVSVRGRTGGFALAKAAEDVPVTEVLAAMDEHLVLNICASNPDACPRSGFCMMHPVWAEASEVLKGFMARQTLASIAAPEASMAAAVSALWNPQQ